MIIAEINGLDLDLSSSATVAVTKAIGKIGDISQRQGDLSIALTAPLNSRNIVVLGQVATISAEVDVGLKRFNGRLKRGSLTISSGYFQIISIKNQEAEIELQFFGGNSDWFERITGKTLKDLNYSDLAHEWDVAEIVASFDGSKGYAYFPLDNQNNSEKSDNTFRRNDLHFGVFVKVLLNKIFTDADLKIGGSLLNNPIIEGEILPGVIHQRATEQDVQISTHTPPRQLLNNLTPNDAVFNEGDTISEFNGTTFTAAIDYDFITFKTQYVLDFSVNDVIPDVTINFNHSGNVTNLILDLFTVLGDDGVNRYEYAGGEVTINNVAAGETITLSHFTNNISGNNYYLRPGYSNFDSYMQITRSNIFNEITAFMPEMLQTDFIKDIMFRHAYISVYDAKSATVFFNKFDEVEDNKRSAKDWSQYIDRSQVSEINFEEVLQDYGRVNRILYADDKEDTDLQVWRLVIGLGLGSSSIIADSSFVTGDTTIYESPFAPTAQRWTRPYALATPDSGNWLLPFLPLFESTANLDTQEIVPRTLIFIPNVPVSAINRDGNTVMKIRPDVGNVGGQDVSVTGYAYFAKPQTAPDTGTFELDDIKQSLVFENPSTAYVGTTLIESGFSLYSKVLKNPIMLKIPMLVPAKEIAELNQLIPVWLEYRDDTGYYYLDEVVQYDGENSTEFKFIKI